MEKSLLNPLKCGGFIKIFAIISSALILIEASPIWNILFDYSFDFYDIISQILGVAPFILFTLYILFFHEKGKASILFYLAFGVFILQGLFSFFVRGMYTYMMTPVINLLLLFIHISAYILIILSCIKGFSKPLLVIGISLLFLFIINGAFEWLSYIFSAYFIFSTRDIINLILNLFYYIGAPLFFITVLVFGLKNSLRPKKAEKNACENLNPIDALRNLKENFEQGKISEEEYNTARASILNKL